MPRLPLPSQCWRPVGIASFVMALATACGDESIEPTPTATVVPTAVPDTPVPSPTAIPTPTEGDALAGVVALVLSGDAESLAGRLAPRDVGGASRVPFAGCEATYVTVEEAASILSQVLLARGPTFHSAMRASPAAAEQAFPLGPYAVVFQTVPPPGIEQPTGVLLVTDADGRIQSFRTGCRATPQRLAEAVPGAQPIEIAPAQP